MTDTDQLKLAAIDEEDLSVLSAFVQDAVLKVGDMVYLPGERRFAVAVNRFVWEKADERGQHDFERRRAALSFDRVLGVRTIGIDRNETGKILELLAVRFDGTEAPGGKVTLVFAGSAMVEIEVEVIEARLADLGAAWATRAKPNHPLAGETKASA
jgi:hypothetical protein